MGWVMVTRCGLFLVMMVSATAAGAAAPKAADKAQPPPPGFVRLIACQSIKDNVQRLACYDREVASVSSANSRGDLVVMDREQVRKTRRSLFGLSLPDLGVFGGGELPGDADTLETTIRGAKEGPDGKWWFNLAEGGTWVQLDSRDFIVDPAPGQPVKVRRGAMNSYIMNVNKQTGIKVHRIN
jgi:hypothetical protein